MNKHVLITDIDLDGAGCTAIFKKAHGNCDSTVFNVTKGLIDLQISCVRLHIANGGKINSLTLADVTPASSKAIAELDELSKIIDVNVYDHHDTAINALKDFSWMHGDNSMCGAALLFDALCEQYYNQICDLEQFVDIVNDYDMWTHANPNSKRMNSLFSILGMDEFVERCILKARPSLFSEFEDLLVSTFESNEISYAESVIDNAEIRECKFGSMAVMFAERCQSLIGQMVRDRGIEVDFAAIVDLHNRKVSLRSVKPGFDVSEVAVVCGGGGHKPSAGYEIDYDIAQFVLEAILP